MRGINTQESDCSDPRWNVASRGKQVHQKEKLKEAVGPAGRTPTEHLQTFPSRSIESDGLGSITISRMTCIQIIRDKHKIETKMYREELRSEYMIKLKREKSIIKNIQWHITNKEQTQMTSCHSPW